MSDKGTSWTAVLEGKVAFSAYLRTVELLAEALKEVFDTGDLLLLLKAEQALVEYDSDHYCQTVGSAKRQNTILDELADLERLVMYRLRHSDGYDAVSLCHLATRDVKNGLPLDGVRKILASHIVRTDREVASRTEGHSSGQLAFLHQRRENVKQMEDIYKNMQREGLGVTEGLSV